MDYFCKYCGTKIDPDRAAQALRSGREPLWCRKDCRTYYQRHGMTKDAFEASLRRICKNCGKPFVATTPRAEFCCKKCNTYWIHHGAVSQADWDAQVLRRLNERQEQAALRATLPPPPPDPEKAVEKNRAAKNNAYFAAVFRLPEDRQIAEMSLWTSDDHVRALDFLDVDGDALSDDPLSAVDDGSAYQPVVEPTPFDEEDFASYAAGGAD